MRELPFFFCCQAAYASPPPRPHPEERRGHRGCRPGLGPLVKEKDRDIEDIGSKWGYMGMDRGSGKETWKL